MFFVLVLSIVREARIAGFYVSTLLLLILLIGAVASLLLGLVALAETSSKLNRPLRGRWMAVVGIVYAAIFPGLVLLRVYVALAFSM